MKSFSNRENDTERNECSPWIEQIRKMKDSEVGIGILGRNPSCIVLSSDNMTDRRNGSLPSTGKAWPSHVKGGLWPWLSRGGSRTLIALL